MIISWRKNPESKPIETEKALGFKIKHNDEEKIMWIPKSQIRNNLNPGTMMADIPDWIYDRKIDELFFN